MRYARARLFITTTHTADTHCPATVSPYSTSHSTCIKFGHTMYSPYTIQLRHHAPLRRIREQRCGNRFRRTRENDAVDYFFDYDASSAAEQKSFFAHRDRVFSPAGRSDATLLSMNDLHAHASQRLLYERRDGPCGWCTQRGGEDERTRPAEIPARAHARDTSRVRALVSRTAFSRPDSC